ncbi:MAG: death domain-containing protein [Proteobacteria bacterium]|nr:death domain-containing protein [Pseudomonadota bacterium]
MQLGIESHELEKIEKNYPQNVDRQMAEVIKHWLHNSSDCSWEALASAVEKMGGHGNLVKNLRDRHLENTTNTSS